MVKYQFPVAHLSNVSSLRRFGVKFVYPFRFALQLFDVGCGWLWDRPLPVLGAMGIYLWGFVLSIAMSSSIESVLCATLSLLCFLLAGVRIYELITRKRVTKPRRSGNQNEDSEKQ